MMLTVNATPARARIQSNPVKSREDLQELVKAIVDPVTKYFSPGGARVRIGTTGAHFAEVAADFEGFARPLWGLAPLLAGGGTYPGIARWVEGLKTGPDPTSEEYWGRTVDHDQLFVEMAAIGTSLALAPGTFWTTLSSEQQTRLNDWLLQINDYDLPPQNWRFFLIFVNLGLKMVGARYSQEAMDRTFAFVETFYDETGWPTDGQKPHVHQTDYYASSFAIPFYTLVYSKIAAQWDPERCALYRERGKKMALDVVHLFAPDGNAIPFGRSLTYRFAMSAFWAAAAYAELELPEPLSLGAIKGILLRNIRSFVHDGDITMPDGTLNVGYKYLNFAMSENYNSPQSPYWCLKSFLPLALPPDHPFWTAEEAPYPSELLVTKHVVNPASQVFSHAGGHTFLLTSGQFCTFNIRHAAEKYSKFAYSSAFGFSVPTGAAFLDQHAIDSMLGLSDDPLGERWRVRRKAENVQIDNETGIIKSDWCPWSDVTVTTWLVPPSSVESGYHLRVHRIVSNRRLWTAEGSFALLYQAAAAASSRKVIDRKNDLAALSDTPVPDGMWATSDLALAYTPLAGAVGIRNLLSPCADDAGHCVLADPNSNLMVSRTVIPTLKSSLSGDGRERWLVHGVFAIPSNGAVIRDWVQSWNDIPRLPDFVPKQSY